MTKNSFKSFYSFTVMSVNFFECRIIKFMFTIFNMKRIIVDLITMHQYEGIRRVFTRTREYTNRQTDWMNKQNVWSSLYMNF